MYVECKAGGLAGPARIGRVRFSNSGMSIYYRKRTFARLRPCGYKANYVDVETQEEYWISGCRKDGMDALYSTDVTIDEDVREEYWVKIRGKPEDAHILKFRARGKY